MPMLKPFTNLGLIRKRGDVPAHGVQRQLPPALGLADYSPCGQYRYTLGRDYPPDASTTRPGYIAWLMLNPSSATELEDDPTVQRCFVRSRALGFAEAIVVNLFAFRSTAPAGMLNHLEPIGTVNDLVLREVCGGAELLMLAWGVHGRHLDRDVAVLTALRTKWRVAATTPRNLYALGINPPRVRDPIQRASPSHPLYQSYDKRALPLLLEFDEQHLITGCEVPPR
jgi:hypothetical protein